MALQGIQRTENIAQITGHQSRSRRRQSGGHGQNRCGELLLVVPEQNRGNQTECGEIAPRANSQGTPPCLKYYSKLLAWQLRQLQSTGIPGVLDKSTSVCGLNGRVDSCICLHLSLPTEDSHVGHDRIEALNFTVMLFLFDLAKTRPRRRPGPTNVRQRNLQENAS